MARPLLRTAGRFPTRRHPLAPHLAARPWQRGCHRMPEPQPLAQPARFARPAAGPVAERPRGRSGGDGAPECRPVAIPPLRKEGGSRGPKWGSGPRGRPRKMWKGRPQGTHSTAPGGRVEGHGSPKGSQNFDIWKIRPRPTLKETKSPRPCHPELASPV